MKGIAYKLNSGYKASKHCYTVVL